MSNAFDKFNSAMTDIYNFREMLIPQLNALKERNEDISLEIDEIDDELDELRSELESMTEEGKNLAETKQIVCISETKKMALGQVLGQS